MGKPNQPVPPAPLHPIPVLGEPFERVLVDCVGPLPKTKSGHQYILTVMCAATRYPEAIPLRTIRAKPVVKALTKFFTTFGLPKTIQSDQGKNVMPKLFSQVMRELQVKHVTSSPYHPESQGALERFHQTLKSMIRPVYLPPEKDPITPTGSLKGTHYTTKCECVTLHAHCTVSQRTWEGVAD